MIQSQYVKVGGLSVQYDTAGDCGSPVLLFVHGWASSSRMWREAMEALAGDFQCLAPDLPGFGESERPPAGWYTLPNYLRFLHGFCDSLGIRQAHLVGHSMGGTIALGLAADAPERVDRLVAVNPVVTGKVWLNMGRFAGSPLRRAMLTAARALWPVAINPVISWSLQGDLATSPGMRRRREDLAKSAPDAVLSGIRAVVTSDISVRLAAISAPTLVMIGEHDTTVPPSEGRLAADLIGGAALKYFAAGHLPSDEQPDEFAEALREFLL